MSATALFRSIANPTDRTILVIAVLLIFTAGLWNSVIGSYGKFGPLGWLTDNSGLDIGEILAFAACFISKSGGRFQEPLLRLRGMSDDGCGSAQPGLTVRGGLWFSANTGVLKRRCAGSSRIFRCRTGLREWMTGG
jgi:hypothetical protein